MAATGHWNIVVKTPMGELKIEADLTEDGTVLSGTMHDDKNPPAAIQEPKVDGSHLTWKFPVKKPFATTLLIDVKIDGDAMAGSCKAGMFPAAPLTGVRG